MSKKLLNITMLLIFLISLISFSANAAFGDIFRAGLTPIEDFFNGGWRSYEKTVVFLVFFLLFFSAYLIGMKKAMGELTRAHTVFAFTAAFLSAFIITVSMRFDWVNLEYIAWFLIGVLTLFGVYALLGKMGLEKHKFWAFILALILTALLLWLIWYLMSEGRPLERLGGASGWLRGIGERARGISGGSREGKSDLWPGGVPPTGGEETTGVKGEAGRQLGKFWWIIIAVIALITGGAGAIGKLRGRGFGQGIKDAYGYPFKAHKLTPRHAHVNLMLKKRLKKYIADILEILKDPRLTEEERKDVELRLKEAIKAVDDINNKWVSPRIKLFEKRRDRINRRKEARLDQAKQTPKVEGGQEGSVNG